LEFKHKNIDQLPLKGAFDHLTADEVRSVLEHLRVEKTERVYANRLNPTKPPAKVYKVRTCANRVSTHPNMIDITYQQVEQNQFLDEKYEIRWNYKMYKVNQKFTDNDIRLKIWIDNLKFILQKSDILKFSDYFKLKHEFRGHKLKKFGI
jgi:hypothetical protein